MTITVLDANEQEVSILTPAETSALIVAAVEAAFDASTTANRSLQVDDAGNPVVFSSVTTDQLLSALQGTLTVGSGQIDAAQTVTIANGASLSGALDTNLARLAGIVMPAAWTAASITFQTSPDGVTYYDLYTASAEYAVSAAGASRRIILPLADFLGVRYIKVRSGTSASPVNQGGSRVLTLVLVP